MRDELIKKLLNLERRRLMQALIALPVTLAGCGAADAVTAQSPTAGER